MLMFVNEGQKDMKPSIININTSNIKENIFFREAVHILHGPKQHQGECTLGYHVLICNVLHVWMDQITPEKKVNSNWGKGAKNWEDRFINI